MKYQNLIASQFSDNVLTLSGEILVTPILSTDNCEINMYDAHILEQMLQDMRTKYPFLQIKYVKGLVEHGINFFCHEERLLQNDFLDCFQEDLCKVVASILKNKKLCVRVNVFGTYETIGLIQEYRYLNKKDDVRYKITDEKIKGKTAQFMRPVTYFVVLLVLVASYFGYQGYRYVFSGRDKVKVEEKIDNHEKIKIPDSKEQDKPKQITSTNKI